MINNAELALIFLRQKVLESSELWGSLPEERNDYVTRYMYDESFQRAAQFYFHLFGTTKTGGPVLDMAAGCGQYVFWCLKKGYDCYGIEPEPWKLDFIKEKILRERYPKEWQTRIIPGYGESLPYSDNRFQYINSDQTLEHVQNPDRVIKEMIRVTKPGGGIHIRCPDYRGTFEAHYRLPWLPLFPRHMAKLYLHLLGRPTKGLDTLQYVTKNKIYKAIRKVEKQYTGLILTVIDVDQVQFNQKLWRKGIPNWSIFYLIYKCFNYCSCLFRAVTGVNIFIRIVMK